MPSHRLSRTAFAVCALFALNSCISGDNPDNETDPDLGSVTENLALPPPTNVVATAVAPTQITVTWDAVAGGNLKYYIVDRGTAPGNETTLTSVAPTKTTWTSTNLTPGQQYCWDIRVVNTSNEVSGKSNESCVTTPLTAVTPVPANLTATAISSSRITVAWSAVTGATVYHVFMATGTTGTFAQVASVTPPSLSTVVANLAPATTYLFEVSAVTANGESARSAPVSATTFQLGIEGYWKFDEKTGTLAQDSSGFHRDATLVASTFATAALPPVNVSNKSALAISGAATSVANVTQTGPFRFAGADFSLSTWIKLAADTPTDFVGVRAAGCGALGWKLGQDATNQLNLQGPGGTRSFGVALTPGVWTQVAFTYNEAATTLVLYVNGAPVATSSYAPVNGLAASVPLQFGHVGGCVGGDAQLDELHIFSATLSAADIGKLGTIPPATTLSVAATNATTETLTWTAVPNADLYYVYKGTAAGNEVFFTSVLGNKLTFIGQHLTPLTSYTWFVRATAGSQPYSTSNEASATTPDVLPAPTGVTATAAAATRVNVAWNAVAGATSYKIFQSTSGGPFTQVAAVVAPTVTRQISNLTTKTTYQFEVLAVDAGANAGHLSAPVSVTTP